NRTGSGLQDNCELAGSQGRRCSDCKDLQSLAQRTLGQHGEETSLVGFDITRGIAPSTGGKITDRGDAVTGKRNNEVREVPMIPDMRRLLERLRCERGDEAPDAPVMRVRECQKAMDRAARVIGMSRITHHDLRHLFATRSIEAGVDIPTVSRWLGHKDGGALAMKV